MMDYRPFRTALADLGMLLMQLAEQGAASQDRAKCVGAPRGSCFGKSRMAMQNRDTAVLPLANITEARFPS